MTGWTNLINHVNREHREAVELLSKTPSRDHQGILRYLTPKKGKNIFGWMEIIMFGLRPFSTVDDKILQRHLNLDPISVNTFKKNIDSVVKTVKRKITDVLPDRFALVFDGWSSGDTHFIAIFATCPAENTKG